MGVVLRSPGGELAEVSVEEAAQLLGRGWSPETPGERADRVAGVAQEEQYGGTAGAINTALVRGAGAASLGLSDVLLTELGGEDSRRALKAMEDVNPTAAVVGEVGGALLGATGAGALLPVGRAAKVGSRIAKLGEEAGVIGRVASTAGGAAVEGAAQGAGSYITDVALGDRELSADGFVAAMGRGALFGGVAGGALATSAGALTAARRMFPRAEMTSAAVQRAEREAIDEVATSIDDTAALKATAREKLGELRRARAAEDPAIAAKMDEIRAARQREMFARAETATAKAERAEIQASKAKSAVEKARGRGSDGIPGSKADVTDGMESTVDAKTLLGRGVEQPPGVGADKVKMDKARAAIAEGQRDAVTIAVDSRGKLVLEDGRHRLAAAAEAGKPVKVRWYRGIDVTDAEPAAAPTVADDLMAQLQGTKSALDDGATIGELGAPRLPANPKARTSPYEIEDAQNRVLAEVDPNAAKLVAALDEAEAATTAMGDWLAKHGGKKSAVAQLDRKSAVEDWIAARRNKGEGWQTVVPEGEGNAVIRRGRQMEWRGSEDGRAAAEARIASKVTPAERESADAAVQRLWGRRPEQVAAEVVDAAPRPDVDSALEVALKRHTVDIDDDIASSVDAIGRHEQAQANLADELGPYASPRAAERAAKLRDAQRSSEQRSSQAAADTAVDVDRAMSNVSLPGAKGAGRSALGSAADLGTAWEALHMMGVPLPDPRSIPVIGPVVSAFLKARVLGKAFGRFGGKVAETAETTIASKAAATKQRVFDAVDAIAQGSSTALGAAAPKAGGAAAVLGHVLFDDRPTRERRKPYSSEASGDLQENFAARSDELARAAVPGAVRAAVRDRVRASDPEIVDAIVAGQERKLGFLFAKLPKQDAPDVFQRAPQIAKVRMRQFAAYVEAAEDPAGVLEAAARGESVSVEAAETLRQVYPRLYQDAQRRLVEQIADGRSKMSHARKVQAALLFDLPLSGSPDFAAYLQEPYAAQNAAQSQAAPMIGQPTIAAPINLGAQSDPYSR